MLGFQPGRAALYTLLFVTSAVLLGLTAKRVHDFRRSAFGYEPVTVLLLVTSVLSLLWSLQGASFARRWIKSHHGLFWEFLALLSLFTLFIVGASRTVGRGLLCGIGRESCAFLRALKAFAWICWALTFLALLLNAAESVWGDRSHSHSGHGPAVVGRKNEMAHNDTVA